MMTKELFEYAKLFEPETGERSLVYQSDDLVMGPETKRKYEENDDCAVTVCVITYNHEHLIRQALDSFVSQKTTFKYRILVGEDHGPDGTADIVREYAEKYPDLITAFCREENMGAQRNLIDLCNRANSPYIAICEGDDYWIDDYKLQKQFAYMQSNPKTRVCYSYTEIMAPEDWHLNSYYKHEPDGKMIFPKCEPSFIERPFYTIADFCNVFPGHTSSVFYRWDYDLVFPEWYFDGIVGDVPMTMLQMGPGRTEYIQDVTSVYRRSDVGVFMNGSTAELFLNTRMDYVRLLVGVRSYLDENFDGIYHVNLDSRISREIANFLKGAKELGDFEKIDEAILKYPSEFRSVLMWYKGRSDEYTQIASNIIGTNYIDCFKKSKIFRCFTKTFMKLELKWMNFINRCKNNKLVRLITYPFRRLGQSIMKAPTRYRYFHNGRIKKQKNLWVITSFRHRGYMDNTMYFYEYVSQKHPEIDLVWLTTDKAVFSELTNRNMRVLMMDSPEGINVMKHAEIAITDHFVSSDYPVKWGFNSKTKVVQLWHGVGFKSMGNGQVVENTKEPGVQYSYDILAQPGDGPFKRLKKKILYHQRAPFRELFEEYFMLVCPGTERVEKIGQLWNVKESAIFMAGHPRDIHTYSQTVDPEVFRVMYAPTYRFNVQYEKKLITGVINEAQRIQELMEELNGEFYLRLHPHTWRNYDGLLRRLSRDYDRIKIDSVKDVYTSIGTYNLMITDYSSIGLDFANHDKPVLFYCPDYQWFINNEAGFGVDFMSVIPGPMTSNWNETLYEIRAHFNDPTRYTELRKEKIGYFFDPNVNSAGNSERIVNEIKRRIGIEE